MGEALAEIGDLLFSLVIGYIGAIELLYVARHLYHWSFRHSTMNSASSDSDADNLAQHQRNLRNQLNEAEKKERLAGAKLMQDDVPYQDGFRIDPNQAEIDMLKDKFNAQEANDKRRKEIELELLKQKQIEIETRKQLEEAEARLAKQRKQAAEDELKRQQNEAEENIRKLLEAERMREEKQRQLDEQEEAAESERKLLEIENQRIENERHREEAVEEQKSKKAEEEQKIEEAEHDRKSEESAEEELNAHMRKTAEEELEAVRMSKKFLSAERAKLLSTEPQQTTETAAERKQKLIEENARKFIEAELEMVELQEQLLEAPQQRIFTTEPQEMPVIEELCIRKVKVPSLSSGGDSERLTQTVKTQFGQFGQTMNDSYTSKSLLFPGVSDDASSLEPNSSKQSSLCTQPSEEIATTGPEELTTTLGIQIAQLERQDPDGEDNTPAVQYTDEYLRSLDGIKNRPLVREDGSGRRRAYKKRRSSGSSTSSRDSRASREEELKMFTSLEEEEMINARKGENDFTPINYAGESTLKVKPHNRRHKRSPAKDAKSADDNSARGSREMLGEENTNPWGELVPEHYKDTEFWKREKAISIDEEVVELEKPAPDEDATTTNFPRKSSFEAATQIQNEEALAAILKQLSEQNVEDTSPSGAIEEIESQQNT